jgi:hypothetical protein
MTPMRQGARCDCCVRQALNIDMQSDIQKSSLISGILPVSAVLEKNVWPLTVCRESVDSTPLAANQLVHSS